MKGIRIDVIVGRERASPALKLIRLWLVVSFHSPAPLLLSLRRAARSVGGFEKEYQVHLDPNRLAAHGIPLQQVAQAIRRSNNDVGGACWRSPGMSNSSTKTFSMGFAAILAITFTPALAVLLVRGYGEYADLNSSDWLDNPIRLELFVPTAQAESICELIMAHAHTGLAGDGIIAVQTVDSLYNIRSRQVFEPPSG